MKSFKYLLLLIPLLFFTEVKAASYTGFDYSAQLYDNLGPSLSSVTTSGPSASTGYYEGYVAYTANSSGAAWGISSPITLIANHTYTLTASVPNECGIPKLSTYNRIGIGTSLANAKTSYQNNTNADEVYSKAIGNNTYLIQFAFTPTINASFIVFPFATSVSCSSSRTFLESISIEDLGVDGVTQNEINSSLNNQTSEINNSINNSTNTITGAITDVEDSINNNIKENFNSCRDSVNLLNVPETLSFSGIKYYDLFLDSGTYTISAESISSTNDRHLFLIYIQNGNERFYLTNTDLSHTFTINSDSTQLVIYSADGYDSSQTTTTTYKKLMIQKGNVATKYEPYGEEICSNKIDETNDKLDETNNQLGDLNNNITDDSAPDIDGLGDSAGWLPPGPLDSVLNLPLSLFNSLTTNLNKSCSPVSIPLPYVNKNLTIPCINSLYEKIGVSTFITWLGVIVSGLMLYTYLLKLYKWIEDRISLNETHSVDNWGGL